MIPGITASTRRESGINVPSWAPLVLAAQDGESDGRAGVVISGPCIVRYTYSDGIQDVMMYETGSFQFTAARVEIWPENSERNSLTINYEYPPADIEDWGDFPFEELYIGRWGGKVPDWLPDSVWHIGGLHCTDPNISNWDTSNVTSLRYAFKGGFINPADISKWDVSNVVDMVEMCYYNTGFNQDLSKWCVPSITSEPEGFSEGTQSWTLPKPVWGTCPQEGGGGESEPDLGPGPWDIDPEHPEYFIPGRYIVSGSGANFPGYAYIGTGSTPEAACNGLRSAMWGQLKDGVHSNQDAHNNRLTKDGQWCRIGTIWDDRITEAYIYDGIDAYIASGRDPMSAVRYANGDEE